MTDRSPFLELSRHHAEILKAHVLEYHLIPEGIAPAAFAAPPGEGTFIGLQLALDRLQGWAERDQRRGTALLLGLYRVCEMWGLNPVVLFGPNPRWLTPTWTAAFLYEVAHFSGDPEALTIVATAFVTPRVHPYPRVVAGTGGHEGFESRLDEELPGPVYLAMHQIGMAAAPPSLSSLWNRIRTLAIRDIEGNASQDAGLAPEVEDARQDPARPALARLELRERLAGAGLSPLERAVVALKLRDLPEAEIARCLSRRRGTVSSVLARARRKLRSVVPG